MAGEGASSSDEEYGEGREIWDEQELEEIVQTFPFNCKQIIDFKLEELRLGLYPNLCVAGFLMFVVGSYAAKVHGGPEYAAGEGYEYEEAVAEVDSLILVFCVALVYVVWNLLNYLIWSKPNIEDDIRAQHVAVTGHSVMFLKEKHYYGSRTPCEVNGKFRKTIELEKITDVQVDEPAGRTNCGLMEEVITTVNIQTASTQGCELSLKSLEDPQAFRKLIFELKKGGSAAAALLRGGGHGGAAAALLGGGGDIERADGGGGGGGGVGGGGDDPRVVAQLQDMNRTCKSIEMLIAKKKGNI